MAHQERVENLQKFLAAIHSESDRSLALFGAASIDEKLAETLAAFFCRQSKELLLGKNALLGSFSARIYDGMERVSSSRGQPRPNISIENCLDDAG